MSGYMPSQVSYYIASALLVAARFASTGFDNVSGTSWTGLKSVSTSQLVPSWGRTIRCVDGRHYGEILHKYQSQESTTNQCDTLPYCPLAYIHSMYDAKGNSSPLSNLQRELTCIVFPLRLMELYQWEHFYAKPGYSHPLSGVADPTGNGLLNLLLYFWLILLIMDERKSEGVRGRSQFPLSNCYGT